MSTSCLLSLDFTGEDEIIEFAFPYDVAGKTCLSLFDGPEELAFSSHSLKHRDVGFMCCIRDTEHPTIEPHFCGSMFLVNAAERVHDSQPYKSTDQMKHLRSLTFRSIESLRSLRTGDIWLKLVLAIPIRLLISFSHLPSDVNIDPR